MKCQCFFHGKRLCLARDRGDVKTTDDSAAEKGEKMRLFNFSRLKRLCLTRERDAVKTTGDSAAE